MTVECWLEALQRIDVPAEFPRLRLSRASDNTVYDGPGSIVRTASGILAMKCYSPADFRRSLVEWNAPAGTLVPHSDRFTMEAVDMYGHPWRAEGLHVDSNHSLSNGVAVVYAEPYRLFGKRPKASSKKCHLSLVFCTDARFPANQRELAERKIGDRVVSAKFSWDAAEFVADGLEVRVFRDDKLIVVQVSGEWQSEKSEEMAGWVNSALQFTIGQRLIADVITLDSQDTRVQIIQSIDRERLRPKVLPPLEWTSKADAGPTWEIFTCFLRYLRSTDNSRAMQLSRWSSEVVDSGVAALEVTSLVRSVAVEGIVRLLQLEDSQDTGLAEEIDAALEVAVAAPFQENLKPRIVAAIKSMARPRASDHLKKLARTAVVQQSHVDAWTSLRNWSTHAEATDGEWIAGISRKSDVVLALYYRLVFHLIGYRGAYTDYGELGWPERSF